MIIYYFFFSSSAIRDPAPPNDGDKRKIGKTKRERPPPQVLKQKNAPAEDKEFVKTITSTTTPLFEAFSLNPGVSLFHDGKSRIEPRPNTASYANLTEPGLRLTRADYYSLTRTGNLMRDGLSKTVTQTLGGEMRQVASAGDMKKGLENLYIQDENIADQGKPKQKKNQKTVPAPAVVKISSAKILETLTNTISEMDEYEANLKSKAVQEDERRKKEKRNADAMTVKSPIDEFNINIMAAKDWGRSLIGAGGILSVGQPQHIKANPKQVQQTLGFTFAKKPRERIPEQETVKTHLKHLPPPMVGKTIGHGLYAGVMTDLNFREETE
jgi:ribosomal protein L14E/L6E/L27E